MLGDNIAFWSNMTEEVKGVFREVEVAFKRFQAELEGLGFQYTYLDVFPFDERAVVLVFGEHARRGEFNDYFSIGFEDITPDYNKGVVSFLARATWWVGSRVPTEDGFVVFGGFDGVNGFVCYRGNVEFGARSDVFYDVLIGCYGKMYRAVKEKRPYFPFLR